MTTLFISDLHLSKDNPQLTHKFLTFLKQQATQAEALYILGDFFDVWIGDDDNTKYHQSIIGALKQIQTHGVPIYFMVGNRDFLIGERFAQLSGCQLIPDPSIINLYGIDTLLKHGDDLCINDKSHLLFRRITRNPTIKKLFLIFPLAWRCSIAKKVRTISRQKGSKKKQEISDIPPQEIIKTMGKYKINHFIHGHTHRPMIHIFDLTHQPKVHFVLSDWDNNMGNALSCDPNGIFRMIYF